MWNKIKEVNREVLHVNECEEVPYECNHSGAMEYYATLQSIRARTYLSGRGCNFFQHTPRRLSLPPVEHALLQNVNSKCTALYEEVYGIKIRNPFQI